MVKNYKGKWLKQSVFTVHLCLTKNKNQLNEFKIESVK